MARFIAIQDNIFCEPCKECGARPVIEQVKGAFVVRCPREHYKTKAGLINMDDWNLKNKAHPALGNAENPQKAS